MTSKYCFSETVEEEKPQDQKITRETVKEEEKPKDQKNTRKTVKEEENPKVQQNTRETVKEEEKPKDQKNTRNRIMSILILQKIMMGPFPRLDTQRNCKRRRKIERSEKHQKNCQRRRKTESSAKHQVCIYSSR
ncbi:unnamed protein product [Mytilus coruscus]|uniref:Uncharacterized protein n=1 Tax=Mytilus coruscus TaxID=42192 RepID=A0A6J8CXX6_MYTCO|nr:unnamed protein product [Mytilus coruscus]